MRLKGHVIRILDLFNMGFVSCKGIVAIELHVRMTHETISHINMKSSLKFSQDAVIAIFSQGC